MEFVIISLVFLLVLITYGIILRKKLNSEITKVESWKIDIMNRPVTDEIAKVKKLNMTGQTEEKFEFWRQSWDEIITVKLPEIEERLFDAEEAVDRYRFKKTKNIITDLNTNLENIENEIKGILNDLKELVGSEEKNSIEIEELKFIFKKLKKTLLANRHELGKAEARLEIELEELEGKFEEFTVATNGGNYLEAREIVLKLDEDLTILAEKMEDTPILLAECIHEIPAQINEITNGYREMLEQGYVLQHLEVMEQLETIEKERVESLERIEKSENIKEVKEGIYELKEKIEQIYDLLEQEVRARHEITNETHVIEPELHSLREEFKHTKEEANYVQLSYQLMDRDFVQQKEIEKSINVAIKKYHELQGKVVANEIPASNLQKELLKIKEHIHDVKGAHDDFQNRLKTLRSDELLAKETIIKIRKLLLESKRLIEKSNLPGLPEHYLIEFDGAKESLTEVQLKLNEKPLNISAVNELLEEAQEAADQIFSRTEEMIEKAYLTEKVIQYGNRYRTKFPIIAAKLTEAEQSFRLFNYDEALEQAAIAIEEVEPGGMENLNEILETIKQ